MSNHKDHYKTLGLNEWADEDAIKKAYRKLALKYHPDRNAGDKFAEEKFKKVTEAYRVLSNSKQRGDYDRTRSAKQDSPGSSQRSHGHGDEVFTIFESFSGTKSSTSNTHRKTRGSDLQVTLSLSFEDAVLGTIASVELTRQEPCSRCKGTGIEPRAYPMLCPTCSGKGRIRQSHGHLGFTQVCHECDGTGRIYQKPCTQCRGESCMPQQRKISVNIPPNVMDGAVVDLPGEADCGRYGGAPGALHVHLRVRPHEFFGRQDHDIWYELLLSITQVTLGDVVEVPTLEGKVRIRIPPGTQPAQLFRLSQRGVPYTEDGRRGDLFVKIKVHIPTEISSRQRQLLAEFARLSGEKSRNPLAVLWRSSTSNIRSWIKQLAKKFGSRQLDE